MKSKILFACALLSLSVAATCTMTACTSTHQQESAGQYVDSSTITVKVKAKLLADDGVKGLPITVKTYKNNVQLSGFVDNRTQKRRAEQIARSVVGVRSVENSLIVK